jgi:hypothetical protein
MDNNMENIMKSFLLTLTILTSFSTMAYETQNSTSYSGPRGGSISGSTNLSGTSNVAMREQVAINQSAVASFLQSDSVDASTAEIKEIAGLARAALHESINNMNDREAIESALSK